MPLSTKSTLSAENARNGARGRPAIVLMTAGLSMATPKGPRFQVVRLPGQFTRGRWDCWDYREQENKAENVLVFETAAASTPAAHPNADVPATVPIVGVHVPSNNQSPTSTHDSSDTIVVTSIAQVQPTTPQPPDSPNGTGNFAVVHQKPTRTPPNEDSHTALKQPSVPTASASQPALTTSSSGKNLNKLDEENEGSQMGLLSSSANVVAIDNKIEQAMDLVKTHLTFAVREEVETLRNTITELEMKVQSLEHQNQLLRQYAPADVVANLTSMLQNRSATTMSTQLTDNGSQQTHSVEQVSSNDVVRSTSQQPTQPLPQQHQKLQRTGTAQDLHQGQ